MSTTASINLDPQTTATGSTTLTLYQIPADLTGSLTINDPPVPVTINTPGQRARLTFAATGGQVVTVRMTANTTSGTHVFLLRPDNTQITYMYSSATNFNISATTLPTSGTYTVVVDPYQARVGSVSVQVTSP